MSYLFRNITLLQNLLSSITKPIKNIHIDLHKISQLTHNIIDIKIIFFTDNVSHPPLHKHN